MKKLTFETNCTKRVTFILVTKNRGNILKKALERAKILKKGNDELIVVDGNSSDNTMAIIKKYKKLIDKFISEPDISPTHATNKAILISSGKYVKLIPDDDIFYEDAMEEAVHTMELHQEIEVLECGGISYNVLTKKYDVFCKPPGINFGKNIDDMFKYRSSGLGLIIRRSVFAKVGLFPTDTIISDSQFIVNCFLRGIHIRFLRVRLFKFNIHTDNISLNPESSKLILKCIQKNASKKYFVRYAFNWYLNKYKYLKISLYPLTISLLLFRRINRGRNSISKRCVWDGGFS